VSLNIPFFGTVEGTWEPSTAERNASWDLYVQLVTRVAVVQLEGGSLQEALDSLYQLFGITRGILTKYGPDVAVKRRNGISFGRLAVAILNYGLRPLTLKWHRELVIYEATRPPTMDKFSHEHAWDGADEMRAELDKTRLLLTDFAELLEKVANVESLLPPHIPRQPPEKGRGGG
jgi:hypothetical protein